MKKKNKTKKMSEKKKRRKNGKQRALDEKQRALVIGIGVSECTAGAVKLFFSPLPVRLAAAAAVAAAAAARAGERARAADPLTAQAYTLPGNPFQYDGSYSTFHTSDRSNRS